jgi:hypothetical protein
MGYDVKFETVDNGRDDLTFKFGADDIINLTQEQVKALDIDHRTAFKLFSLIVTNMQTSAGFQKMMIKADSFDKLMGTNKDNLDGTIEKMLTENKEV